MLLRLWLLVLLVCVSVFAPSRAGARVAENRTWVFAPTVTETRLETAPQAAGTHQESGLWNYEHAPGCSLAAERIALRVATPYGPAIQAESAAALAARSQVQGGATLYRVGTMGKSAASEAQFWALESPLNPGFAARHGIPPGNVEAADFIETAMLRPGAPFVTRVAPGVGGNGGGAIEVVVEAGGVRLRTFSTGTPGSP